MEALKQAVALLQGGGQVTAEQLLALLQQAMAEMAPAPAPPAPPGDAPAAPAPQAAPAPAPAKADARGKDDDVDKVDWAKKESEILAKARAHADARASLLAAANEVLDHVDTALTDDDLAASIVLAVSPEHESLLAATDDSATIRALCDAAVASYRARRSTGRVLDSRRVGGNDPIAQLVKDAIDPWRPRVAANAEGGK